MPLPLKDLSLCNCVTLVNSQDPITWICPEGYQGPMAHPYDCHYFYICDPGRRACLIQCASNLYYNPVNISYSDMQIWAKLRKNLKRQHNNIFNIWVYVGHWAMRLAQQCPQLRRRHSPTWHTHPETTHHAIIPTKLQEPTERYCTRSLRLGRNSG